MKFLLLPLTLFFCCISALNAKVDLKQSLSALPPGTQVSFLAQDMATKKKLVAHNDDFFRSPASVQKLITALAARLQLGPNFRFKTQLLSAGTIHQNKLDGDLILKTSGDPTFTHERLNQLFASLKQKGITEIKGNLIIDTSVFAGHDKAPGWSWENLTFCYNVPPSAAIVDRNCFLTELKIDQEVGELATLEIKSQAPVRVESEVLITGKLPNAAEQYCEFNIEHEHKNQYVLTGCYKQAKKPVQIKFAVQDGAEYLTQFVKRALAINKIKLTGQIQVSKKPIDSELPLHVITASNSAPLPVLLNKMLKTSDNLIADALFRTLGASYYKTAGTWQNGSNAVKSILKNKAKIDLSNAVIKDGSGLSRQNLIDTNKILAVLNYISNHDEKLKLIKMLPVSGKDGTLLNRLSFKDPDLKLAISAKTGYLTGVYNMAGFLKKPNGEYIAFVQLVSGYNLSGFKNNTKSNLTPIAQFERSLYKQLLAE